MRAQMKDRAAERSKDKAGFKMPSEAQVMACGGGTEQMDEQMDA